MIRVLIAEDHHLVREAIHVLLERAEDIAVVGEASDGQEAIEQVSELQPDVLVIDISMPKMNGILATEAVRRQNPSTQVVILSIHSRKTIVRQALQAGALGYILKGSVSQELLKAIRSAAQNECYINDIVATLEKPRSDLSQDFKRLTMRELQVLQLVAEGQTNKEIADELSLHVKTIEKHRASLIAKLGVRDVPTLVQIAIKLGLLSLDE